MAKEARLAAMTGTKVDHPASSRSERRERMAVAVTARKSPPETPWYLAELFVTLQGRRQYLWRPWTTTAT